MKVFVDGKEVECKESVEIREVKPPYASLHNRTISFIVNTVGVETLFCNGDGSVAERDFLSWGTAINECETGVAVKEESQ